VEAAIEEMLLQAQANHLRPRGKKKLAGQQEREQASKVILAWAWQTPS
jgi:hypothetical protein